MYDYSTSYTTTTTTMDPATAAAFGGFMLFVGLIMLAVGIITLISMWKLFTKAGKPGWAAIVPIYNIIVMLEIVGRPLWWTVLYFIPFANVVVQILVTLEFAKVYGKDTTFGVLMIIFPVPMYQILAFSKTTQYMGPIAHEQTYGPAPATPAAAQPVTFAPQSEPIVAPVVGEPVAAPSMERPTAPEVQPPVAPSQPQQ
ncbi:MAG: DUF5684 domain-containing protein [Candidatus Saccharimonas sp.]